MWEYDIVFQMVFSLSGLKLLFMLAHADQPHFLEPLFSDGVPLVFSYDCAIHLLMECLRKFFFPLLQAWLP